MWVAVSMLVGCGADPSVTSVQPDELVAGEMLEIHGEHLPSDATLSLLGPQGAVPLELKAVGDEAHRKVRIPEEIEGTYDLHVQVGRRATTYSGLRIELPHTEPEPCSGDFTANTQLSLARREVVIERFFRDGDRETIELPLDQVRAVAFERSPLSEDQACTSVWLQREDGERVLFDDDDTVDLEDRARKIARDIERPFQPIENGG